MARITHLVENFLSFEMYRLQVMCACLCGEMGPGVGQHGQLPGSAQCLSFLMVLVAR